MSHTVALPDTVIEAMTARRGRRHAFERLAADRTALLVIDMQTYFLDLVPAARAIVPNINRLAATCRRKGAKVVWIVTTLAESEDGPSRWPLYHEHFFAPALAENHKASLTPGSDGHALDPGLRVADGDLRVDKRRFSPFIDGSSDLRAQLARTGTENLIIAGTLTNVCCESTARDAMMLDYRVVLVDDANAARNDAEHLAALVSLYQSFADVRATDDIAALLE